MPIVPCMLCKRIETHPQFVLGFSFERFEFTSCTSLGHMPPQIISVATLKGREMWEGNYPFFYTHTPYIQIYMRVDIRGNFLNLSGASSKPNSMNFRLW